MSTIRSILASALGAPVLFVSFVGLASTASAQLGPWKDGELIVRSVLPQSQTQALYRVDPLTAHGEVLADSFYFGGWSGGVVYDSFRDQLLMTASFPPEAYTQYKLWAINSNGTKVIIPGFDKVALRALCPTGDGRIYYQRNASSFSTDIIEYLDAANVQHPLLDDTGTQPLTYRAEHLIYHAPSNSLIGTNSAWWSPQDCTPNMGSIFRIPLSPDGSMVGGPIVCTAYATSEELMSLDLMPGGKILLTLASGSYPPAYITTVDPYTLATSVYANPTPKDIDGGMHVPQLGGVVILDDTSNLLRLYTPGSSGMGVVLPTDFPVSAGTTGYSPSESLYEVDKNGPGCFGYGDIYGAPLAGKQNVKPSLTATGCPNVGGAFTIAIGDVVGGASGLLFVGLNKASLPLAGGTLHTFPIILSLPITVGGTPGTAGAGTLSFPVLLNDPALVGFTFYMQGAFADAGAIQGASLTNGLQITMG